MNYSHPEVLVDTKWVEDHLNDPKVRIAEVDYDPTANYVLGHIPGSVLIDWKVDINDPLARNILSKQASQDLLQRIGVSDDTTLILYGDFNNWFAAFAFWALTYYGVKNMKLMNGGRKKWLEEDKALTKDVPTFPKGNFKSSDPDNNIRVFLRYVSDTLGSKALVDVRSPKEFTGEIFSSSRISDRTCSKGWTYSGCSKYSVGSSSK